MTFLYLNLALVFFFSYLARFYAAPLPVGNIPIRRPSKLFMLAAIASLVIVSGLRRNIGDTFFYRRIYEINDFTWEFIQSQKDIGFGLLQMVLKNYISEDPQIMVFTTALLTNILIVWVLYRYSRMIELSLYVYITGGLFLVTMNGIRQALAAAIIFTATKFLMEGDWKKYFLLIILASFFHQSALVMLPIYFLVRFKAWSKATFALIVMAIVIVIGFDKFSSILFSTIENTQYGEYKNFAEGGASFIRVIVNAIPLMIAFLGRGKLKQIYPNSDPVVNMSLIGFVFMLIATQNWIFARFSLYFGLFQLILISWIIKVFREKDQKLIYFGIIICYFLYFYFENVMTLNIDYRSDYLIWNF